MLQLPVPLLEPSAAARQLFEFRLGAVAERHELRRRGSEPPLQSRETFETVTATFQSGSGEVRIRLWVSVYCVANLAQLRDLGVKPSGRPPQLLQLVLHPLAFLLCTLYDAAELAKPWLQLRKFSLDLAKPLLRGLDSRSNLVEAMADNARPLLFLCCIRGALPEPYHLGLEALESCTLRRPPTILTSRALESRILIAEALHLAAQGVDFFPEVCQEARQTALLLNSCQGFAEHLHLEPCLLEAFGAKASLGFVLCSELRAGYAELAALVKAGGG